MLVWVGEKTQCRLSDDKKPSVVCDTDRACKLCSETHLEDIIPAVDLGKNKQDISDCNGTTFTEER
jgi:hypothetical protein